MFLDKYGERIDFIGRENDPRHGKIVLAVEVDRWYRALGSWTKLADIRALSFRSVAPMFLSGGPLVEEDNLFTLGKLLILIISYLSLDTNAVSFVQLARQIITKDYFRGRKNGVEGGRPFQMS